MVVDVGDLKPAAAAGFERLMTVKTDESCYYARDGVVGFWPFGFFFDADDFFLSGESRRKGRDRRLRSIAPVETMAKRSA
jgi:hypothetical protein